MIENLKIFEFTNCQKGKISSNLFSLLSISCEFLHLFYVVSQWDIFFYGAKQILYIYINIFYHVGLSKKKYNLSCGGNCPDSITPSLGAGG